MSYECDISLAPIYGDAPTTTLDNAMYAAATTEFKRAGLEIPNERRGRQAPLTEEPASPVDTQ